MPSLMSASAISSRDSDTALLRDMVISAVPEPSFSITVSMCIWMQPVVRAATAASRKIIISFFMVSSRSFILTRVGNDRTRIS